MLDADFSKDLSGAASNLECGRWVNDAAQPLIYKGVVFNEMKGVYSSPDQLHFRALKKALFRGHPIYAIDSGGDPRAIPSLTYEQFKSFHEQYCRPTVTRHPCSCQPSDRMLVSPAYSHSS